MIEGVWASFDIRRIGLRSLQRLLDALAPGGEIVVGNFAVTNPSRPYMEFGGEWLLNHRSADQLIGMAMQCGIPRERIAIGCEPLGVNLFLHVVQEVKVK